MDTARTLIDTNAMEWADTGIANGQVKLLKMYDDFSYIDLYRIQTSGVAPAHVHLGPTEVLFLSGAVETIAGKAGRGFWVLEPGGAMHRATQILEPGVVLNHTSGPLAMLGVDGTVPMLLYGQSLRATLSGKIHTLKGRELTNELFPEDYDSGITDMEQLEWKPSGYPGVDIRILRVFDNGHFTIMIKAEDGSKIPARHYTAPTDFFVMSGGIRFGDGAEARADYWIYEPTGRIESAMTHVGETIYLATCTGAFLDLANDGTSIERVVDGHTIHKLAA
ncbi:cupin domain-containing protein [Sphingobium sp. HWE2-09]|uniref:cupin domain-containing protein n=1 Tax=Sphingobium sp. HWE2-09 TaxID=3108390 RepID=UPI002DC56A8C|nr:hypothetical protein [Sphingobium sp. HWE2-09]